MVLYYLAIGIIWVVIYNVIFAVIAKFKEDGARKIDEMGKEAIKNVEENSSIRVSDENGNVSRNGYLLSMLLNMLMWPIAIIYISNVVYNICKSK